MSTCEQNKTELYENIKAVLETNLEIARENHVLAKANLQILDMIKPNLVLVDYDLCSNISNSNVSGNYGTVHSYSGANFDSSQDEFPVDYIVIDSNFTDYLNNTSSFFEGIASNVTDAFNTTLLETKIEISPGEKSFFESSLDNYEISETLTKETYPNLKLINNDYSAKAIPLEIYTTPNQVTSDLIHNSEPTIIGENLCEDC